MKFKTITAAGLVLLLTFGIASCTKKEAAPSKKELNIYVDIKDKHSLSILKFIIEEYKKKSPETDVKANDVLGNSENIAEEIGKEGAADLILTSRNKMIELAQKGLLSDLAPFYEKLKVNEKYYNILGSYGRFQDKYYGIGVIPYIIEVLYNKDALTKINVSPPANIKDIGEMAKKLSSNSTKIPVVSTEDLDIYSTFASIVASNRIKVQQLEGVYDSSAKAYKELKDVQGVFDDIKSLSKDGNISKNSFEVGSENSLDNLIKGTVPIVITTSYYNNKFADKKNIELLEDYSMTNTGKDSLPVIVNFVACTPTNAKNKEESDKFMGFIFSQDTQEKLVKKGFLTANKKADDKLTGIDKKAVQRMAFESDNNILFIYNMPKRLQSAVSSKAEDILGGKYTGKEWEEAVDEAYKQ